MILIVELTNHSVNGSVKLNNYGKKMYEMWWIYEV